MCEISECGRPVYSRGLCEPHYRRRLRTGRVGDVPVGQRPAPRECMAAGCERTATERGLCHGHYLRLIRNGAIEAQRPLQRQSGECGVDGCERRAERRGLCRTHANRKRKFGDVQADKPIRDVAGDGFVHHGYRCVPVPAELRHLTAGEASAAQHRLVMAQLLGRALTADESVHHRNGDRLDNRPENLELWSRWQPTGQRVVDKVAYAVEILQRYLPAALAEQLPLIIDCGSPDEI